MEKEKLFEDYVRILQAELIPAMGCTEPIAIAYAAARARQALGRLPERICAHCSGNIIKNVKGVSVPNAGGLKGVEAAAILGAVAGDAELGLEVVSHVTPAQQEQVRQLYEQGICSCRLVSGEENLYVRIEMSGGPDSVCVTLQGAHDHISKIEKNGEVLWEQPEIPKEEAGDKSQLNLWDILRFADEVPLSQIEAVLKRQIAFNSAISQEGLKNCWGVQVGQTLLALEGDSLKTRVKAAAAAGSDARMSGCCMPVVINSGSGNQGITVSMPVIVYAGEKGMPEEKLLRALALSNLISIHQKRYIGNLSAYCGAVSAGTAAACGVAYLDGADYDMIGKIIINALGAVGGIVCDGAKASCAAKIASAVEAGMLAYEMAKHGRVYSFGEGLVEGDYEQTIRNMGRLGREGMRSTDEEILHMMTGE
ncbi:MAG: L-serine ammonia-lyase, iron-sulfur-dependent, subunit alpha [Eubacteriales bacterium]|nr:L-serine ammonia-lyase, iron-sulfur-dependent, subunit alpha [Eubacteriales bacterium]